MSHVDDYYQGDDSGSSSDEHSAQSRTDPDPDIPVNDEAPEDSNLDLDALQAMLDATSVAITGKAATPVTEPEKPEVLSTGSADGDGQSVLEELEALLGHQAEPAETNEGAGASAPSALDELQALLGEIYYRPRIR